MQFPLILTKCGQHVTLLSGNGLNTMYLYIPMQFPLTLTKCGQHVTLLFGHGFFIYTYRCSFRWHWRNLDSTTLCCPDMVWTTIHTDTISADIDEMWTARDFVVRTWFEQLYIPIQFPLTLTKCGQHVTLLSGHGWYCRMVVATWYVTSFSLYKKYKVTMLLFLQFCDELIWFPLHKIDFSFFKYMLSWRAWRFFETSPKSPNWSYWNKKTLTECLGHYNSYFIALLYTLYEIC